MLIKPVALNLGPVWATLGPNAAFTIANQARPNAEYLFNEILPERRLYSYDVRGGSLIVVATMAGLVGMDSPYPESGAITLSAFLEKTAKIAHRIRLPEETQRELHTLYLMLRAAGDPTTERVRQVLLNFVNKLVEQPLLDTREYLRGRALMTGAIDWKYNKISLKVDYKVPGNNRFDKRTGADAYGGATSKFWADISKAQSMLDGFVQMYLGHSSTIEAIVNNPANKIEVTDIRRPNRARIEYDIRRVVGTTERLTDDKRYNLTLVGYRGKAPILRPDGTVKSVSFVQPGEFAAFGQNDENVFSVSDGTEILPPEALGYHHLAPTTEGGGVPGDWAWAGVPANEEWAFEGKAASNNLPVITEQGRKKIILMGTELP